MPVNPWRHDNRAGAPACGEPHPALPPQPFNAAAAMQEDPRQGQKIIMQPVGNRVNFAGGIPPSTLDAVNPAQYALIQEIIKTQPRARLASLYGLRLFDVARIKAGTALPLTEFELFANPVGTQQTELNGTTQYTKSFI